MCIDSSLHSEVVIQRRIELISNGAISPKEYCTAKLDIICRMTKDLSQIVLESYSTGMAFDFLQLLTQRNEEIIQKVEHNI